MKKTRKKRDTSLTKLDSHAFINLNTNNKMKIKKEDQKLLGKFMIEQGYKIAKGQDEKTFDDMKELLKQIVLNIKKLKDSYED